ncbi:MAG TPA: RNA 2',3'-cyclic phosphodiesterase [Fimbriimonadaceae bacterium]|nr:RNA 2',3'-cyclic phosphodiesterase [Fimbriimonadaceae bacterium]
MRCFLAVQIPEASKDALEAAAQAIESEAAGFYRWTSREQMHLTLYFLGEMEETGEVVDALRGVKGEAVSLSISGLVRLPETNVPKVLAGGVTGEVGVLERTQRRISDTVFAHAAFKETRRYYPHVTFGRLNSRMPGNAKVVKRALAAASIDSCEPFEVRSFDLVKSTLTKEGPEYETVESFSLV